MNVTAVIVTRGDQKEGVQRILEGLPSDWERIVWNNGAGNMYRWPSGSDRPDAVHWFLPDLGVYGRYAAIDYATSPTIYVQDDDCIVSDPIAIVEMYDEMAALSQIEHADDRPTICCNQPEPWRSNPFYADHALVGFGAAFGAGAPWWAFDKFWTHRIREEHPYEILESGATIIDRVPETARNPRLWPRLLLQTCDVLFTGLCHRVLANVPHESLDYAYGSDRMWRQPFHQPDRDRMVAMMREVRDAA